MFSLELKQIFNNIGSHLPIEHSFDMSNYEVNGANPIKKPVKVTGEVNNKAGIVGLAVQAQVEYSSECDRCAAPVIKVFNIPIKHILVTELNDKNNSDFTVVPSMRLDLEELVAEEISLYLPTKFLCNEDCKGICTFCGKNLNEDSCSCKKPIDPRLEVLQQLLDK
ncbi:MAG: DUF177 domain-containing protein [Clostridiales bacterium]|jgi:uncharacterized protein|nr:DUF177 domain-containing protein [Clostridiales bacterium]